MARRPLRARPVLGPLVRAYEERLTARGRFLLWATVAFAFLGADTRRTDNFVLFAAAASTLLVAVLLTAFRRPKVRLECRLPFRATALTPVPVKARVVASGDSGLADLLLTFPRPIRWGGSIAVEPRQSFLETSPAAPTEATVLLRPLRRGRYVLRGPTVRASDPLRLTAGRRVALDDQPLLVYPRYWSMDRFDIPLGRRYQPGGIPLSSSTGDAIEFIGTRDYREGDPIKNIHWRSWARRGQPVVKEYQEEYFCRIAIVLDTFLPRRPSRRHLEAFEAAISVVASVADFFSRSEYVVDILAAGPDLYEVSAGRSLAYLENILDVLSCLEPCRDPPFATVAPPLFDKLAQITTVVAVLQDWDAPREEFLRKVKALGTAVRAVIVCDRPAKADWPAAAEEIGEVGLMSPADVERALASHA
ncbi:MAG TPA: DUF58 domain-containing protein [Vicinamibacteria bacterium]